MRDPVDETTYPVARCAPCGRVVVTHAVLDDAGAERRACVHCDADIDPGALAWVPERDLDGLGYGILGEREHCGRPECGGGACGRGGG